SLRIELPLVHAGNEPKPAAIVPGNVDGVEPIDEGDDAPRSGREPCVRIVTADQTDAAAPHPTRGPQWAVIGVVHHQLDSHKMLTNGSQRSDSGTYSSHCCRMTGPLAPASSSGRYVRNSSVS